MTDENDALSQLRTSHFWLVLASLGLLVTAALPRSAVYEHASDQATQALAINATLTQENLQQTFRKMDLTNVMKSDLLAMTRQVPWHIATSRCQLVNSIPGISTLQSQSQPIWMAAPGVERAYPVPDSLPPEFAVSPGDRTLQQLMKMWAFLVDSSHAFIVTQIDSSGVEGAEAAAISGAQMVLTAGQTSRCSVVVMGWLHATREPVNTNFGTVTIQGAYETVVLSDKGKQLSSAGATFESHPLKARLRTTPFPLFESHLRRFFGSKNAALVATADQQFEDGFPDLAGVSKGLESLRLHDLRSYIVRLARESATDVELFGARLPIEVIRAWGLPLLAVMQLYFLLHIRMLTARRSLTRESHGFPWIALYADRLARVATVCSIALAPAAAAVLCWSARDSALFWWQWTLPILVFVTSTGLAGITAVYLLRLSGGGRSPHPSSAAI